MRRWTFALVLGLVLVLVLGLVAGCADEKTPTCEEAIRHTAEIMKHTSKKALWGDARAVEGQIYFCKSEKTDPRLLRCVMKMDDEAGIEHCIDTFGRRE
jgi:hypothetical protein